MSRAESLDEEQVWADRKSAWHLSDVPSLVGVGSGRVWLEMQRWIHQHLVAAKVARWVESPRELLVMGSGKGWRPDPGAHSQSGSAPEPTKSWAQSRIGDHLPRALVAKRTGH